MFQQDQAGRVTALKIYRRMPPMFNWIQFLTYAVSTTMTPGPNNIMSMSNASRAGLKKSYPFNIGIWCGFSIVMIICALFTSALSALIPKIRTPMLVLGACYMLYLAWKTFRRPTVIEEKSSPMGFLNGFVLEFMNPKIFIYGIVSMEGYILPYYEGNWPALIAFAILLATIGCFFNICWALFGTIFSVLFSKYGKITNTIMALLLVYCAISLFR